LTLKKWLTEKQDDISARWCSRIRATEGRDRRQEDGFLDRFLADLVGLLPFAMDSAIDEAEEAWNQSTYLFGSFALHRGLAAGEVVEEFSYLREEILKLLLDEVPLASGGRSLHLELLTLSRALDTGAVRASVAYVDDLFFAHLQGSGVTEGVSPELEEEMARQLEAYRKGLEPYYARAVEGGTSDQI
jgi:hypothetical protein